MTKELALNAKEYGLEPSKAKQMEAVFAPMVAKFKELEADYKQVMELPVDEKACSEARRVRLSYVKIRTATDRAHKDAKESLLIQTRAIDGLRNIVKYAAIDHENSLEEREKHFELLEQQRKQELHNQRLTEIERYDYEGSLDFGEMSEEVWVNFLTGTKANYLAKIEAERKAEEERIERERVATLHEQRKDSLLPYWEFVPTGFKSLNMGMAAEREYRSVYEEVKKKKAEHEAEQERIKKENKRLQKEREDAARKAKAEKDAAEKRAEEERKLREKRRGELQPYIIFIRDYDSLMGEGEKKYQKELAEIKIGAEQHWKNEREKAQKEAAEKAMLEAEKVKLEAERAKILAEEEAKKEAERKAKAAPDKEKLIAFSNQIINISYPELTTEGAVKISQDARGLLTKTATYINQKAKEL